MKFLILFFVLFFSSSLIASNVRIQCECKESKNFEFNESSKILTRQTGCTGTRHMSIDVENQTLTVHDFYPKDKKVPLTKVTDEHLYSEYISIKGVKKEGKAKEHRVSLKLNRYTLILEHSFYIGTFYSSSNFFQPSSEMFGIYSCSVIDRKL